MQQSSNERVGQEDTARRLSEPRRIPGSFTIDPKVVIAVVLFVTLGTLAVYIGFQTLPAPKSTVMEPMLGMAHGNMDSMPTTAADKMNSMPTSAAREMDSMTGMASGHSMEPAADSARTLQEVRAYFRDNFGSQPYYAMITGYTVDQSSLTIHTNIDGLDAAAMQNGRHICVYADRLLKHGGIAIEEYEVLNHADDRLCSGP